MLAINCNYDKASGWLYGFTACNQPEVNTHVSFGIIDGKWKMSPARDSCTLPVRDALAALATATMRYVDIRQSLAKAAWDIYSDPINNAVEAYYRLYKQLKQENKLDMYRKEYPIIGVDEPIKLDASTGWCIFGCTDDGVLHGTTRLVDVEPILTKYIVRMRNGSSALISYGFSNKALAEKYAAACKKNNPLLNSITIRKRVYNTTHAIRGNIKS